MPHILDSESDFHLFRMCWCQRKVPLLHIGDDTPLFGDKNVKDMKDAHAVDSDEEAPFAPDYKQVTESRPLEGMHNCCVSDDRLTLQGTALGEQNGLPLSIGTVIKLVRTRRIEFLGLWPVLY